MAMETLPFCPLSEKCKSQKEEGVDTLMPQSPGEDDVITDKPQETS